MNIFKEVKEQVTARQAAEYYGVQVDRRGMAKCVFHDDHTPSMKVDRRYHCFGCQADGDVIDLTAKIFGLSPYEAARKIAADFHLVLPEEKERTEHSCKDDTPSNIVGGTLAAGEASYGNNRDTVGILHDLPTASGAYEAEKTGSGIKNGRARKKPAETEAQKKEKRIRKLEEQINAWLKHAEEVLIQYFRLLQQWEKNLSPAGPNAEMDPLFTEAIQRKDWVEQQLNILQFGSEADRLDFSRRRERW